MHGDVFLQEDVGVLPRPALARGVDKRDPLKVLLVAILDEKMQPAAGPFGVSSGTGGRAARSYYFAPLLQPLEAASASQIHCPPRSALQAAVGLSARAQPPWRHLKDTFKPEADLVSKRIPPDPRAGIERSSASWSKSSGGAVGFGADGVTETSVGRCGA